MNEQDKAFARQALEKKQLTIEQVQEIRAEVDRSGRSFRDVAVARGLIVERAPAAQPIAPPPPRSKPMPPLYVALLAASFLIFGGLLIATLALKDRLLKPDPEQELEIARSQIESDRTGAKARRGYAQGVVTEKEKLAREHLTKARAAMARVDTLLNSGILPPELTTKLNEAFIEYNMYLKEIPDDAAVRVERARTHELRRNYDLAIVDLQHAISLEPGLEPALQPRIAKLREQVARKPQ